MKQVSFVATASAAQTLPENAVEVESILVVAMAAAPAVFSAYTVSSAAPAGSVAQFAGTPAAPSATVTFPAALVATDLVIVNYKEVGSLPSNF